MAEYIDILDFPTVTDVSSEEISDQLSITGLQVFDNPAYIASASDFFPQPSDEDLIITEPAEKFGWVTGG